MKAIHIPPATFLGWAVIYALMGISTGEVAWYYSALGCFALCVVAVLGFSLVRLWREKHEHLHAYDNNVESLPCPQWVAMWRKR